MLVRKHLANITRERTKRVRYNGKELQEYSKHELVELLTELLLREEARDKAPSTKLIEHDTWTPPKIAGVKWNGKGKPGGS